MSDGEMIEKYKQIDYILHLDYGWLWQDILRYIGSGIIFSLMWLNNMVENIVDKSITLNDFYSSGPIKEFMDVSRPIIWGLFLIALLVLGFQFMLNKIDKRNEIVLNVILAVCVIVVIPDLMVNMGKLTNAGINHIKPEKSSLSAQIVKSNVADVLYYAENDFNFSNGTGSEGVLPRPPSKNDSSIGTTDFTYGNRLSEEALVYLPYTQKLDFFEDEGWFNWTSEEWVRELSDPAKELLKNRMVAKGVGNEFYIEELDKNMIKMTKIGRQTYYRYHVNWGVLIFSLLVTTVALVITVIKIGRSVFDLAFHQIFGMFIAATDLTGGQRTKKVLVEIMNTFAVIFLMIFLLKLFILYSSWAYDLKGEIGSIGVVLLLIAGAWALIDAPDIVQRMLGIDAGLRSGWQTMAGSYAAMRTAGMAGKGAGKGLMGLGKGVGKAVGSSASIGGKAREAINKIGEKANGLSKEPVKTMPGGPPDDDPPIPPGGGSSSNDNPPIPPGGGGSSNDDPPIPPGGGGSSNDDPPIPPGAGGSSNDDPPIPPEGEGSSNDGPPIPPGGGGSSRVKQSVKPIPTGPSAKNNGVLKASSGVTAVQGNIQQNHSTPAIPSSNAHGQSVQGNSGFGQVKPTTARENVQQNHSTPVMTSSKGQGPSVQGNSSSEQVKPTTAQENVQQNHSTPVMPSSKGQGPSVQSNSSSGQAKPTTAGENVQQNHSTPVMPSSKGQSPPVQGNSSSEQVKPTTAQENAQQNHSTPVMTSSNAQGKTVQGNGGTAQTLTMQNRVNTTATQSTAPVNPQTGATSSVGTVQSSKGSVPSETHVNQTTTVEDVIQSTATTNGKINGTKPVSTVQVENHHVRNFKQNINDSRKNGFNLDGQGQNPRRINRKQLIQEGKNGEFNKKHDE